MPAALAAISEIKPRLVTHITANSAPERRFSAGWSAQISLRLRLSGLQAVSACAALLNARPQTSRRQLPAVAPTTSALVLDDAMLTPRGKTVTSTKCRFRADHRFCAAKCVVVV
jgi:hypothetical protein